MPITQRAYEQAQQAGGAEGFDPNAFQGGDAGQQKADDGVVDAEFTEVKMTKIICLFKRPREMNCTRKLDTFSLTWRVLFYG